MQTQDSSLSYKDLLDGKFWVLFFITMSIAVISLSALIMIIPQEYFVSISPSSDALTSIVGLPVGLAGSLVAIILAKRSYAISHQQAQYETIAEAQVVSSAACELFWKLSNCIRELELRIDEVGFIVKNKKGYSETNKLIRKRNDRLEKLVSNSSSQFEQQKKLFLDIIKGYFDAKQVLEPSLIATITREFDTFLQYSAQRSSKKILSYVDIENDLITLKRSLYEDNTLTLDEKEEEAEVKLKQSIKSLSDCILEMMRNPICRAAWTANLNSFDTNNYCKGFDDEVSEELLKIHANKKIKSPIDLAQRIQAEHHTLYSGRATHIYSLSRLQPILNRYKWCGLTKTWGKNFVAYKNIGKQSKNDSVNLSTRELLGNVADSEFLNKFKSDEIGCQKLLRIGMFINSDSMQSSLWDKTAGKARLNTGTVQLLSILDVFPTRENLREIVEAGIGEHKQVNGRIVEIVEQNLLDTGVTECISPWLTEAKKRIREKPESLIFLTT
ncbi:hypothetical protein [Vibrio sp. 10N.261.51.C6]|uniref:hypothetical protein n=1 Tax=Vibrio sp. 10N.261.51.C6 TaxID=3229676 RepID=UPI00354DDD2D